MGKIVASFSMLLLLAICAPPLSSQTMLPPSPAADLTTPASALAQEDRQPVAPRQAPQGGVPEADEVVRVETSLVTVTATVMDRKGKYVSNLRQEDFHISENGVEQKLAYFEPVEKPFTVALLIDTSGSTAFRLEDIQKAALAFIDQLRPDDRVMVIAFNDTVEVLTEATSDRERLSNAIQIKPSDGGTHLYDAVELVIKQRLARIPGRKAVVLFTDGVDNRSSNNTYENSLRNLEESDVLVYPVQYDTFIESVELQAIGGIASPVMQRDMMIKKTKTYPPGFNARDYERATSYLHAVARKSGTRFYHAESLKRLAEAFALIAQELRQQYSLGYYPQSPAQPGQRRQLNVSVAKRGLLVRARNSYTAAVPSR